VSADDAISTREVVVLAGGRREEPISFQVEEGKEGERG